MPSVPCISCTFLHYVHLQPLLARQRVLLTGVAETRLGSSAGGVLELQSLHHGVPSQGLLVEVWEAGLDKPLGPFDS